MVTLGAAMVTLLTDNWAGAGAPPTFGALIDYQKDLADTEEQVIVRLPIYDDADPINDILSNFKFTIQLRVKTTVDEDRLKVLTDETIRIINTYAITGITRQFAKRGENTSDRKRQVFSHDIWANLEEHASTGGTSYSSPGAGDVAFPADVTVAGTLGVTGDATVANLITAGNVDGRDISADIDQAVKTSDSPTFVDLTLSGTIATPTDVSMTGELDMTGADAKIDLNPANATGADIINITGGAAISSGHWKGVKIDANTLDPSAGGCTIKGIDMTFAGVNLTNNPNVDGLYILMPATYGGGIERAGYFSGDGRSVTMCSDTVALLCVGDVQQQQGCWNASISSKAFYFNVYNNFNNGNPTFRLGSSVANHLVFQSWFNAGTQELDHVKIKTITAGAGADDGRIVFECDGTETLRLLPTGASNAAEVTGNLKVSGDITDDTDSMTVANLADLLSFGSANAAWVPCMYWETNTASQALAHSFYLTNVGAQDFGMLFALPLPTNKGGLKLYINSLKVGVKDADDGDELQDVFIFGATDHDSSTQIYTDSTDREAPGTYTYAIGSEYDCSSFKQIYVQLLLECTNAGDIDISFVQLNCYYAA